MYKVTETAFVCEYDVDFEKCQQIWQKDTFHWFYYHPSGGGYEIRE